MTQTTARPTTQTPRTIHNKTQRDTVTFLTRTDGTCDTFVEVELAPGGGTPLHTHTEHFTRLQGTLGLHLDGQQLALQPGESATVPIGAVHRFYNATSEMTIFRAIIAPGHRGFEQSLILNYGLVDDDRTNPAGMPKSLMHLALLADLCDVRLVGRMAVMNPVIGLLARVARRRGLLDELIQRYDPRE